MAISSYCCDHPHQNLYLDVFWFAVVQFAKQSSVKDDVSMQAPKKAELAELAELADLQDSVPSARACSCPART